ncbi:hypothetical protein EYR40_005081 [Pleurotus pulmonarius]|nr:hypothetical protein EYR36_006543 [Pleurotus pulmonarius]KAF4601242.1 hypothetical protein EYR38_005894 [Pleurotus pulmonarius]KAF4601881.1 hypothetical protein EYR40_005081 [Pleurotus pulmonarius]
MAYSAYDMGRQISRRGSMSYAPTPYPYSDPGVYSAGDNMMMAEYGQPSYPMYGQPTPGMPMQAYDDVGYRDGYYPDDRAMSTVPPGSMAPMMHPSMSRRSRRYSSVSFAARPQIENYRPPSSLHVKFKRKGAFTAGINLSEAQSHQRLSNNDAYSYYDFHPDHRGRILLKIKWAGYSSMTYEIPLDKYDGRVSLSTLARRVSRACVHYLQANIIPVSWDRVQLHHLEEIAYGTWQPMLSTH